MKSSIGQPGPGSFCVWRGLLSKPAFVSASGPSGRVPDANTTALLWVSAAAGAGTEHFACRELAFVPPEKRRNEWQSLIRVSCTNTGG